MEGEGPSTTEKKRNSPAMLPRGLSVVTKVPSFLKGKTVLAKRRFSLLSVGTGSLLLINSDEDRERGKILSISV